MRKMKSGRMWGGFLAAIMLAVIAGCGGPPTVYDQPEIADGYWDVVWVEPRIYEDTEQFTMIRADWVDSIWVGMQEDIGRKEAPSFEFVVSYDSCHVVLDLEVEYDSPVMQVGPGGVPPRPPMFEGELIPGAYRVVLKDVGGSGAVVTGWICDREKKWTFAW